MSCGEEEVEGDQMEVDPNHVPTWGQGHVLLMVTTSCAPPVSADPESFTFLSVRLSHRRDGVLLLDPRPWRMLFYQFIVVM